MVPVTFDVNTSADVFALLHTVWLVGVTVIIGVGFTLIVNVLTGPGQLFAVGVTVKLPVAVTVPVLVAVNEAITLPTPDPNTPIVGLLLVQAYVVPVTFDVNTSVEVLALLHTVWLVGVTVITGVGFTLIVNV